MSCCGKHKDNHGKDGCSGNCNGNCSCSNEGKECTCGTNRVKVSEADVYWSISGYSYLNIQKGEDLSCMMDRVGNHFKSITKMIDKLQSRIQELENTINESEDE